MCRLFALRANASTHVYESLCGSPVSLLRQSGCDRRGQCHDNGWGIGWYEDRQPRLERAPAAAQDDPRYRTTAEAVHAATVLGHVRQASVGNVSEKNTHPFAHRPWLFAHNGTLQGFAADPARLRRLIPPELSRCIEGDTDSEHLFYYLLGRLGPLLDVSDRVVEVVCATVRTVAELFPGTATSPTQLNCVLTDGETMVATRWGHTLFWHERRGATASEKPVDAAPTYRAIVVASEPTTAEAGWAEVPEHSILVIRPDLSHAITPITRPGP